MNGLPKGYADYTDGYIAGINRAINKLVELGKIDVTEAAELIAACISPDSDPVVYDWKLAKKTTP
jgi:hypothetical protein